jgi:hypothetical protein
MVADQPGGFCHVPNAFKGFIATVNTPKTIINGIRKCHGIFSSITSFDVDVFPPNLIFLINL